MPVLGVAHGRAHLWLLFAAGAAELAHGARAAAAVDVDLLADEWGAPAVRAAGAVGLQRADAAAQQQQLESSWSAADVGHRGVGIRPPGRLILRGMGRHATAFAARGLRVAKANRGELGPQAGLERSSFRGFRGLINDSGSRILL